MASLVLSGDTSGTVTVSAPAVAGSNTQTLVAETGTLAPIVSGTAVSASGTEVDFTDIPSWVKRITVMFSGVSTNGTSYVQVQLGDSGGIDNSSYLGATQTGSNGQQHSSGFLTDAGTTSATSVRHGVISLVNVSEDIWAYSSNLGWSNSANAFIGGGSKTLSDTLTQVRITTVGGTNTFDAGTINILYE